MGQTLGNAYGLYAHPEIQPHPLEPATFDPKLGFTSERPQRKMIATEEEMISAKIPLEDRDYCAHLLLEYRGCRRAVWPWPYKCEHEKHAYLTCQYEDYVMRMKEYEREKRLRIRQREMGV